MNQQRRKFFLPFILFVLCVCLIASQFQPALVLGYGGVGGSFGVKPRTNNCLGLQVDAARAALLPEGDLQFHFGAFFFRYQLHKEDRQSHAVLCIGQDISYGE